MNTRSEGHGHLQSQHKSLEFSRKTSSLARKFAWRVVDLLPHLQDKH